MSYATAARVPETEIAADLTISVVVPVRDEPGALRRLIAALGAQTLPRERFEILVGDDGSTDPSIRSIATRDGWIRVASGDPLTSYAARNRASSLAQAPALAFCDADCRPEPNWLEAGLAALESANLVAGLIRFIPPERPTVWTLLDMDTFLDQERAVRAGRAVTANLFVRRELFERVGGFDETLPNTGDYDFVSRCVAAGAALTYTPTAVVWHPTRDSSRAFLGKVWAVNRRYAARESRAGRRPEALRARSWVPAVQTFRGRRRFGRPIGLDGRRLATSGVRVSAWANLRALPIVYLLVPYLAVIAQLLGRRDGRRLR